MHAHGDSHGQPGGSDLLEYLEMDLLRLASPTDRLRVGKRHQTRSSKRPEQVTGEFSRCLSVIDHRCEQVARHITGEREQLTNLWGMHFTLDD